MAGSKRVSPPVNHAPAEVQGSRGQPLGMASTVFLRDFWQRRPLLIRNAFPGFVSPLDANDLAGLACEPVASARIVLHDREQDRWTLETGPFEEERFARVPDHDWTLLVQDCDKLLEEVGALLAPFRFLPDWRVDDVMVSFAAPGGSVGPHVDLYDVFLLQAQGHRHWLIDADPATPRDFRDDVDLKVLRTFTPSHDWQLAPGDMLYLPPNVPHHGIAIDECLTCSIGMRAPSTSEMLLDAIDWVTEALPDSMRMPDTTSRPVSDPALIPESVVTEVRAAMQAATRIPDAAFADWLAGFLTRYRSAHQVSAPPAFTDKAQLRASVGAGGALYRHPWSRFAWRRVARRARLYFAGESFDASVALARLLQVHSQLGAAELGSLSQSDWQCLQQLVASGHLVLESGDSR